MKICVKWPDKAAKMAQTAQSTCAPKVMVWVTAWRLFMDLNSLMNPVTMSMPAPISQEALQQDSVSGRTPVTYKRPDQVLCSGQRHSTAIQRMLDLECPQEAWQMANLDMKACGSAQP